MINFDEVKRANVKHHIVNLPEIPDHPHKILITESSESGKANTLLDLK